MEQIEIKSNWLAYAIGARNNKITIEELNNTRILDFNLSKYLTGDKEIYSTKINDKISKKQIIEETNLFMSELATLIGKKELNVEHISINGLDFKESSIECIYDIDGLENLNLDENQNCKLDLVKFKNLNQMNVSLLDVETKQVKLADYTMKSLGFQKKPTQYELYTASRREHFNNATVDIEDIETISQYTMDMPTLSIKNVKDVKKAQELDVDNINVCLRTSQLQDLVELSQVVDYVNELVANPNKNIGFNQVIDNVTELSCEQLKTINSKISKNAKFDKVKVLKYCDCYEEYSIDKYIKINEKINELIGNIDINAPEIEKFIAVQNAIIANMAFDQLAEYDKKDKKYYDDHFLSSRNLEGGLLDKKCVCAGYSDILRNILKCVNIESQFMKGTSYLHGHAWNQVKIDDNWYNTDVTADRDNIILGKKPVFCLQSDLEFYKNNSHFVKDFDMDVLNVKQCDRSYNINKIMDILKDKSFESNPETIIDTVNGMRNIDKKEYDIIFSKEDGKKLDVNIGCLENNELKYRTTKMYIDKDSIGDFMRVYLNRYAGKGCKGKNYVSEQITHISTQDNVGLIIGHATRKRLFEEGIIDLRNNEEVKEELRMKDMPIDIETNVKRSKDDERAGK